MSDQKPNEASPGEENLDAAAATNAEAAATAETEAATAESAGASEDPLARISALEAEIAKLRDERLRALAEAENIRRRGERDREDAAKFGIQSFAKDLLSVADNLGRAIDAVPQEARELEGVRTLLTGVDMTRKELASAFAKNKIIEVEALGKPLDPNLHQAMVEVESAEHPAGIIVQVYQSGYTLHGRLLRPALVGVSKGAPSDGRVDTTA